MQELTPFENELISLVKNIKFKKDGNHFEDKLERDLKRMSTSNKTMIIPHKTMNIYSLTKEWYDKILNASITATYNKADNNIKTKNQYFWEASQKIGIKTASCHRKSTEKIYKIRQ